LGKGAGSKTIAAWKDMLLRQAGAELFVLRHWPLEEAGRTGGEIMAEALRRLRGGEVILHGGYDGQFGRVELFTAQEREAIKGQSSLLHLPSSPPVFFPLHAEKKSGKAADANPPACFAADGGSLDEEQQAAVMHQGSHLRITAGPGSGKTKVLIERINYLLGQGIEASDILGLTFTAKAAQELSLRLNNPAVRLNTFHRLGWEIMGRPERVLDEDERLSVLKALAWQEGMDSSGAELAQALSLEKQQLGPAGHPLSRLYARRLRKMGAWDLDDLVYQACLELEQGKPWQSYRHILVDEYQDVNPAQAEMLKLLLGRSKGAAWLTVIGDPRQAIYAFRGARRELFQRCGQDFAPLTSRELHRNYRSQALIVELAGQLLSIEEKTLRPTLPPGPAPLAATLPSPWSEARWIARQSLELLGGLDSRQAERRDSGQKEYAPQDIAVIYRLHQQGEIIHDALNQLNIPVQRAKDKALAELEDFNFHTQKVSLLTMHAAKGLEFPVVFIAGLEAGLMPYQPPGGQADDEEEARLLFVALTRGKERLFISRARERLLFGRRLAEQDSPLWNRLQGAFLRTSNPQTRGKARQMDLFA
jgi:DNA helicase-2/ATP-dependent DNA helicase PcrA